MQGKMGKMEKNWKENHATKMTKIPKTKRQKYGMNKTLVDKFMSREVDKNVILPALATGKGGGISIMLEPRPPFLEVVRLMKGLLASGPDRGC